MSDIWFISDQHYNHKNILKFTDHDGNLIRPGFKDIDHMNETMIENHNRVVKPYDKVYFGGDVGKGSLGILNRLHGKKRLILGNHDDLLEPRELLCFEKVTSWRFFGDTPVKFVVSHYPLHPMSFEYRGSSTPEKRAVNVHGHIHEKFVKLENGQNDPRYINICVEKINYTPVHIDELMKMIERKLNV